MPDKKDLEIDVGILHMMNMLFGDVTNSQVFQQDNPVHGLSLQLFCTQPPEVDSLGHICSILDYSRDNGYKATVNVLMPEEHDMVRHANVLLNIRISFSSYFIEKYGVQLKSDVYYSMFDKYEEYKGKLNILISQPLKKTFKAFGDIAQKFLLPQPTDYPEAYPTK